MSDVVIKVDKIAKRYRIGAVNARYVALRDVVAGGVKRFVRTVLRRPDVVKRHEDFWALSEVSFAVRSGECIGIIGRNGAGKSTLLKILSRITAPTSGEVRMRGRVGSLLEVGTGFHPELTGRENVFLNGAILGMSRREVRRKFDEIVAFAEVERFLDTPVKYYSSGMYTRLAFAVAAHLEPEILIVDEVLAVGDVEFQKKCLGKMGEVAGSGRTVLFVSHNMAAVRNLCTRSIVLKSGKLAFDGPVDDGLSVYLGDETERADSWERPSGVPGGPLVFTRVAASVVGSQPSLRLVVDLQLRGEGTYPAAFVALDITDAFGVVLMQALPTEEGVLAPQTNEHCARIAVDLPPLVPGRYSISAWVGPHYTETFDMVLAVAWFEVNESPTSGRTVPHTRDHGWVVPVSRFERVGP